MSHVVEDFSYSNILSIMSNAFKFNCMSMQWYIIVIDYYYTHYSNLVLDAQILVKHANIYGHHSECSEKLGTHFLCCKNFQTWSPNIGVLIHNGDITNTRLTTY